MRKKRLIKNTYAALINQIITFLCGFILPRQILLYFGSEMNGLLTSITQFLGFVALMDMGIGAVVQSNLYKPLADKDEEAINKIVTSASRFFKRITIVLIIYTILLMFVYPAFIYKGEDYVSTILLIFAISISSMAQYLFGITNQMVLAADQKAYVYLNPASITTVLNTALSVLLIQMGASLNVVKLGSAFILLLRPLLVEIYVRKNYCINRKILLEGEPIKQKWNAVAQHIATFIVDKASVVVLTLFSTLSNVSVYYVYHLVVLGLCQIFSMVTTGIQSLLGDMYAKNEKEKLEGSFSVFEWIAHTLVVFLYSCAGVLMLPFVRVYTNGIEDANYIDPVFSWLITIAFAMYCLRTFYNILVKAAGHYKETQDAAIMEAVLNIVLSVVFVCCFGLAGVAIGPLIATSLRAFYLMMYTNKVLLPRKKTIFLKQYLIDGATYALIVMATGRINMTAVSYLGWAVLAVKVGATAALIIFAVNMITYRNKVSDMIRMIMRER